LLELIKQSAGNHYGFINENLRDHTPSNLLLPFVSLPFALSVQTNVTTKSKPKQRQEQKQTVMQINTTNEPIKSRRGPLQSTTPL
jgi:hypothetical protein